MSKQTNTLTAFYLQLLKSSSPANNEQQAFYRTIMNVPYKYNFI